MVRVRVRVRVRVGVSVSVRVRKQQTGYLSSAFDVFFLQLLVESVIDPLNTNTSLGGG
jgi:hypothetical protein